MNMAKINYFWLQWYYTCIFTKTKIYDIHSIIVHIVVNNSTCKFSTYGYSLISLIQIEVIHLFENKLQINALLWDPLNMCIF